MLELMIYSIGVISNFSTILPPVITFCIFILVAKIAFMITLGTDEDDASCSMEEKTIMFWNLIKTKLLIYIIVISTLLYVFIPNQKTIVAMYIIPKIVESEKVENLSDAGYEFLLNYLKNESNLNIDEIEKLSQ